MTTVDLLAEACLRVAASRWPAEIRDEMYREWSAEMHAMKSEQPHSPWRRAKAQLGYTFSLAVSPPPGSGVERGWRTSLAHRQRGAVTLLALFAVGMAMSLLMAIARVPAGIVSWGGPPSEAVMTAALSVGTLLTALLFAGGGHWAGQRAPVAHGDTLGGHVWGAIAAPVMLGAGMLTAQLAFISSVSPPGPLAFVITPILWTVTMLAVVGFAVRQARQGFSQRGRWIAVGVSVILLPLLALPAALAASAPIGGALLSLVAPAGPQLGGFGPLEVLANLPVATAFVLWYATRSARTSVTIVADPAETGREPVAKTMFALALAVAGVAMWAVGATVLSDTAQRLATVANDALLGWNFDIRYAAILLAAASMALALARYGHTLLPAIATATGLFACDALIAATGRTGVAGAGAALFAGVLILAAAWWLGRALLNAPPTKLHGRRTHIVVAVLAGICATAPLSQMASIEAAIPATFAVMTTLLVVALGSVATISALAAREKPASYATAATLVALPNLMLVAAATLSPFWEPMWLVSAGAALPFGAYLVAIVWWERVRNPGTAWAAWIAVMAALAALSVPASQLLWLASMFVTPPLLAISGTPHPVDGVTVITATALAAVVAAVGATDWLAPVKRRVVTVGKLAEST